MDERPHVVIWTDGSNSLRAPGRPGGWAAILLFGEKEKIVQGAMFDCTNNQAELSACIDGLMALKKPCRVDLYTDSEYVKKGWHEWLPKWVKNEWTNALGEDVANQDLWKELIAICKFHDVTFHHVRGHTGIHYNEMADKLAKEARLSLNATS